MRVKTDERRQAIMDAAWEALKANGYERTTMSEISDRVGGSKATLYGYFRSKEELFTAVLEHVIRERAEAAFQKIDSTGDLSVRLLNFAQAYMEARLAPDMIAMDRALIAEADRSDLGAVLLVRFITPQWRRLASVFEQEMAKGRLRRADPYLAVMHFRGMIEADLVERRLHGDATITPRETEAAVAAGVDAFLRSYSAERSS